MRTESRLYFDHHATSSLRPAALAAMTRALELPGNPSSIHAEGRESRAAIERAREQTARALSARPTDVIFTSGATEALNALLRPQTKPTTGPRLFERLLVLATEHAAVRDGHGFAAESVEFLPVSGSGVINLSFLERRLAELRATEMFAPAIVAVQAANNETGVIQPLSDVARLCDAVGAALVVDAVQAIGKTDFDLPSSGAAALALSAHKFGGPKGVGAIVFNGDRLRLDRALIAGGGQEGRRRAGTENVAGIVGMGAALEEAAKEAAGLAERLGAWRDRIERDLRSFAPDLVVFGEGAPRLPSVTLFAVPGLKAETLLMAFDLAGVALSSGSACSSGKVGRSHVLDAMGIDASLAEGAIRASLGWSTAETDIFRFVATCENVIRSLSERKNRRAA